MIDVNFTDQEKELLLGLLTQVKAGPEGIDQLILVRGIIEKLKQPELKKEGENNA